MIVLEETEVRVRALEARSATRFTRPRTVAVHGRAGAFETAGRRTRRGASATRSPEAFFFLAGKSVRETSLDRYTRYCREHDVEVQDLTSFTAVAELATEGWRSRPNGAPTKRDQSPLVPYRSFRQGKDWWRSDREHAYEESWVSLDVIRESVRAVARELMEVGVSELIGAGRGERSEDRATYRNGYRARRCEIELQIPKLRRGSYFPSFCSRVSARSRRW